MAKPQPTAELLEGNVEAWIVGTHELPLHLASYQSLIGMVVVEGDGEVEALRQEDFDAEYEWVY